MRSWLDDTTGAPDPTGGGARAQPAAGQPLANLGRRPRAFIRLVVDRTGLEGELDLELIYLSGPLRGGEPSADPVHARLSRSLPSLAEALRDQLGLRLESRPSTESVLVIDRIERPALDP